MPSWLTLFLPYTVKQMEETRLLFTLPTYCKFSKGFPD